MARAALAEERQRRQQATSAVESASVTHLSFDAVMRHAVQTVGTIMRDLGDKGRLGEAHARLKTYERRVAFGQKRLCVIRGLIGVIRSEEQHRLMQATR